MIFIEKRRVIGALMVATILLTGLASGQTDSPWDLQAVDAEGQATHLKVGAPIEPGNRVVVEGIALNGPDDLLDSSQMWQIFIQAESPDQGGVAAFAAIFYDNSQWPRYPMDIQAGDRIRVEGYAAFHRGKTNINERHSAAPDLRMNVSVLEKGAGLPAPQVIFNLADCNHFDETRASGGEYYQCQWMELHGVHLQGGLWAAGETVIVSDDAGSTLPVLLSETGVFSAAPTGAFHIRGILDQEDATAPFTGDYRLWVRDQNAVVVYPGGDSLWALQAVDDQGVAVHPKAGATLAPDNRASIEGIALNASDEYLAPDQMWQIFIQADGPDLGGVAAFAASFYDNSEWPRYPMDIQPGDRLRVEGFAAFHQGKTNINERHSAAPDLRLTVTRLEGESAMPAPARIPSIAHCNYFDPRRVGGGERWQAQWVQFDNVRIVEGTWGAGQMLTITDHSGQTLGMLLSARGDFDGRPAPDGEFHVRGIFNQENETAPHTGNYRVWVKTSNDILAPRPTGDASYWLIYE